jgi:hypothetical protein
MLFDSPQRQRDLWSTNSAARQRSHPQRVAQLRHALNWKVQRVLPGWATRSAVASK